MQEKYILEVIEELGAIINTYKDKIKYKDIEIESLNRKIERIEQYVDYYSITDQREEK